MLIASLLLSGCGVNNATVNANGSGSNSGSIAVSVSQNSVTTGGQITFRASSDGKSATGGTWAVVGGTLNGTITNSGIYTAPASVPEQPTVYGCYVIADLQYCASVTIVGSAITVLPSQPTVVANGSDLFVATQYGVTVSGGQWAVLGGGSNGSISASGVYTAPQSVPDPAVVTVSYTLSGQSYEGTVTVTAPSIQNSTTFTVQPATLVAGNVTLTLSGSGFTTGEIVFLNAQPMATTVNSSTQITATGFLTPWTTGTASVELAANDGLSPIGSVSLPIAPTAVSFDAAARFSTQAAFGPRPDVVQQIQNMGFDAFITQQFQQPAINYPLTEGAHAYLAAATSGNSLLRLRVAYALETFLVGTNQDFGPSSTFLETKLENDASGNFLQLMSDISTDPNIGSFLNLANNNASTNLLDEPNQNFGRELMQLFSLGPQLLNDDGSLKLDVNGNPIPTYDQNTVLSITRALTGWHYPTPVNQGATAWGIDFSQNMVPDDADHDEGSKLLFGTVVIPAGQSAAQDQAMVLQAIFNHPNLPPFLSRLLIQQLVTSNPSPAYIQRISAVFEDDGKGTRGNMAAVIRAILLDPEARAGDSTPSPNDGVLQSPLRFETFVMSALQDQGSDDQVLYLAGKLGENWWYSPTVFYFFSPTYMVPGTNIHSPEFMLFSNLTAIQRSQLLWGIISSTQSGFTNNYKPGSWLFTNFTTVPEMVDALNHLLYHGQMSQAEQTAILNYCAGLDPYDVNLQLESAVFLAMNSDSYNVSQ
jgi:uncharacterized protein (DUF1800 family)